MSIQTSRVETKKARLVSITIVIYFFKYKKLFYFSYSSVIALLMASEYKERNSCRGKKKNPTYLIKLMLKFIQVIFMCSEVGCARVCHVCLCVLLPFLGLVLSLAAIFCMETGVCYFGAQISTRYLH